MKVKVVGCKLNEGEYNGNYYKNYLLYVVPAVKGENELFGVCPQTIKVRSKFVEEYDINLKSYFQKEIEVYYDSYGNVAKIEG